MLELMSYMCLYLETCHLIIVCFTSEDLVNMQCVVVLSACLVVDVALAAYDKYTILSAPHYITKPMLQLPLIYIYICFILKILSYKLIS